MCIPFLFAEAYNVSLSKEYLAIEKSCVSKKKTRLLHLYDNTLVFI